MPDSARLASSPEAIAVIPRWLTAMFLASFILLAVVASGTGIVPGDIWIIQHVQRLPEFPWRHLFNVGNLLGTTPASPIALGVLGILAIFRRDRAAAIFSFVLLFLRGIAMSAKAVFDSPRPTPDLAHIRESFDGLGFPSGHCLTATIIAGACILVLPRLIRRRIIVRLAIGLTVVWAILCGGARMWFGAHWPSDVLGGFLLGMILIAVSLETTRQVPWASNR